MGRAERRAEEARRREAERVENEENQARWRREADQRTRHRVEAWDHAHAALVNAEAVAVVDPTQAGAWTGIALGWLMVRDRERGGYADG